MKASKKIWNNYEIANEEGFGVPLKLSYGMWQWGKNIWQKFEREGAETIAQTLCERMSLGEPGIPVYQGHPDVPQLASHYPDKGAIGWIKAIEVEEDGVLLHVEWDRFPGQGFGWMSPYWGGEQTIDKDGKYIVKVDELYSLGLVNNPNIRNFRLPNEEAENETQTQGVKMTLEELLKLLGFAEGATPEEIKARAAELVAALETVKAAEVKAQNACAEAEKKVSEANAALENCKKELEAAKAELANAKAETETTKTELANSKDELTKLKSLKTVSVTMQLENQQRETEGRMKLVNEIMAEQKIDFDAAWAEAKARKPELFA